MVIRIFRNKYFFFDAYHTAWLYSLAIYNESKVFVYDLFHCDNLKKINIIINLVELYQTTTSFRWAASY